MSLARKQRRRIQRQMAYSGIKAEHADAIMQIAGEEVRAENLIAEAQPRIEFDTVMNYSTMVLWVLHTEFGFGHDRLVRFYKGLASLGECMTYGKENRKEKNPVDIKSLQQALKEECDLDFYADLQGGNQNADGNRAREKRDAARTDTICRKVQA